MRSVPALNIQNVLNSQSFFWGNENKWIPEEQCRKKKHCLIKELNKEEYINLRCCCKCSVWELPHPPWDPRILGGGGIAIIATSSRFRSLGDVRKNRPQDCDF